MNTGGILESTEIAKKAVEAAIDRQSNDILMLDIRQVQYFADYFVICSAESDRQMRAICDEIHEKLKQERIRLLHQEGSEDSGWALLDFGSVVVKRRVFLFVGAHGEVLQLEEARDGLHPHLEFEDPRVCLLPL